ncbi:hypothetical protein [Nocardia sp. NPDC050406]|uniref:hypothetical protein n=1 Tax=Nocardia sp. NPDC050406 TaxID=3364318 RepID=UPI0037A597BF
MSTFETRPDAEPFAEPNGVYCQYCGSTPAVDVTFRAHRGLVFMMQFRKVPGPFCRDCGLATFRSMTGDSLWQGWWGFASLFINPITIAINLFARQRVVNLPPPIPGAPYQPADPGRPLHQRPQILGALFFIPVLVLLFTIVSGMVGS